MGMQQNYIVVIKFAVCTVQFVRFSYGCYDDEAGLRSPSIIIMEAWSWALVTRLLGTVRRPLFLRRVGLKLPELLFLFMGWSFLRGILSTGVSEGGEGV